MTIIINGQIETSGHLIMRSSPRYWRFETQGTGGQGAGNSISELTMTYNGSENFLTAFTLTNIGGAVTGGLFSNANDGILEVVNAANLVFVPVANGNMDFYVDFGIGNGKDVTVYGIAPQGNQDTDAPNTPLGFNAYSSNDATNWTLVKSFSGITLFPDWNPGTLRQFSLTS